MTIASKHHPYALRLPAQEARKLTKAQKASGQSVNQLIVLCVRKALPDVLASLSSNQRITNVAPLPVAELRKIYSKADELAGVSAQQLAAFQSQEAPE